MILIWDELNIEHIAAHSVGPKEAAEVVEMARRPFPKRIGPDKYVVRGQTRQGRYLQVIYVVRDPDSVDVANLEFEDRVAIEAGELIGYVIHVRDLEFGENRPYANGTGHDKEQAK